MTDPSEITEYDHDDINKIFYIREEIVKVIEPSKVAGSRGQFSFVYNRLYTHICIIIQDRKHTIF